MLACLAFAQQLTPLRAVGERLKNLEPLLTAATSFIPTETLAVVGTTHIIASPSPTMVATNKSVPTPKLINTVPVHKSNANMLQNTIYLTIGLSSLSFRNKSRHSLIIFIFILGILNTAQYQLIVQHPIILNFHPPPISDAHFVV